MICRHPGFALYVLFSATAVLLAAPTSQPSTGWIWSSANALKDAPVETRYFRYEFSLKKVPDKAEITIGCDNSFQLYVNGVEAAKGTDWNTPIKQDIHVALRAGRNAIAVIAANGGGPAWFYMEGSIQSDGKPVNLTTGSNWRWSAQPDNDSWLRPNFNDKGFASKWQNAAVLGDGELNPQVRELMKKAQSAGAIAPPVDWTAFRDRQRKDLASTTRPADPAGAAAENPVNRFLKQWWAGKTEPAAHSSRRSEAEMEPSVSSQPSSEVRLVSSAEAASGRAAGGAKEDPQAANREPQAIAHHTPCDDATFARRAYFDIWGLPPTEEQLTAFLGDRDSKKREKLIDALLADNLAYAQGQMAWWCDLLRNDEQTNIDDLRRPITKWLFAALKSNKPYDQMVAELLNPGPNGPDGYLKGINWRGIVNASQRPPVQAAQNVGQVFLATSIKCCSCHDHFTKPLLLDDSYGLASFFSAQNLEIYRCDKPTGRMSKPEFLIHNTTLTRVAPDADLSTKLRAISEMVTSVRDPNFAPAMVNRLWKKLMGRGLFEPVDDLTAKCANRPLLDWLAYDFMTHDYDLKHTIRLLMTSEAYQLAAVAETNDEMRANNKVVPVYAGPPLRRLSSEQFADTVSQLTGYWPESTSMDVVVDDKHIRAWRQKVPDPLALSMGRPSREQVCTSRVDDASMIQALEMSNGRVLAQRLTEGSKLLLKEWGELPPEQAIQRLYARAIARTPRPDEVVLLTPMVGKPSETPEARRPGWEDAVWIITMSPEFQFIN